MLIKRFGRWRRKWPNLKPRNSGPEGRRFRVGAHFLDFDFEYCRGVMDNVALLNEGGVFVRDLSPADLQRAIMLARYNTNDELEMDDNPATSPNAEGGVWVAAWIYVGPDELFLPEEIDASPVLVAADAVGRDASESEEDSKSLLVAARDVLERWNSGDLAGAVRHLARVVGEVEATRSFEASAVEASAQSSAAHG